MKQSLSILVSALEPVFETARDYDLRKFRSDAVAGLTVAVVAVPQSMAYALIAGVPLEYGLYTLIVQSLVNSLFGSQPLISAGPINTHSLLVASTVTRIVTPGDEALYLQLAIGLTLIKGLLQLVMAAARLGNLVKFVSQSVIVGFTAGAGVLVASGQINNFLGFRVQRSIDDWPGLVGTFQRMVPHLGQTSLQAILMGTLALAIVIGARWISKLAPGPLIAVMTTASVVAGIGWTGGDLPLVGEIPRRLVLPSLPRLGLDQFESLLPGALALSILGLMEAYAIGKTLAAKTGTTISANRELFGQGISNFVSSFFSCIPGSGSFSRSALNHRAGAMTRFSGVFNSVFVLVIFGLLAPLAKHIPLSCIAAILWVIAYGLVDWSYIRTVTRSNRPDAIVCFCTFAATLFLPLAYAVIVGVFLNMALYMRLVSQLHMAEMVPTSPDTFLERPLDVNGEHGRVVFLQIEGDLFFGVADELERRLRALTHGSVQVVIFRLKRTHSMDSTVLQVFERFVKEMRAGGRHVILAGVRSELLQLLHRAGLVETIGHGNVFETGESVFASAKLALVRAQELIGDSIDLEWVRLAGEKVNSENGAGSHE